MPNRIASLASGLTTFAGVGVLSTSLHYLVLMLLAGAMRLDPVLASTAGAIAGAVLSYSLNYRVTFRSNRPHVTAMARFALTALVGFGLNAGIMLAARRDPALHYLACQVIATAVVLVWNFLVSKYWIFRGPADAYL